jgi:SAM-dependent methyltransferase
VPSSSPASPEPPLRLAFGSAAADYERGRPDWPDEVARVGDLPAEAEVLDLGAGTGKLTRVLARRFARVIAVEPDAAMRALLGQVTDCHLVLEGSAEAIPLADASVDGVLCAECFHWFDWPVALREIARVLRPRGILVLCFQMPGDGPYVPIPEEGWEIARRYRRSGVEPGGAILESGAWREPFDDTTSPFEPLRMESFAHVHVQTADEVVARTLSTSVFAALSADERRRLGEELRAVVPDGEYRTNLRAEVWWTRLR